MAYNAYDGDGDPLTYKMINHFVILTNIDVSHQDGILWYFFIMIERPVFLHNVENVQNGKIIFGKKIVYCVYGIY